MRPLVIRIVILVVVLLSLIYLSFFIGVSSTDATVACGTNKECLFFYNFLVILNGIIGLAGLVVYAWTTRKTDPYFEEEKKWSLQKKRNMQIRSIFMLLVFFGFGVFFVPVLSFGPNTPHVAVLGPLAAFIVLELFLLFLYRQIVGKDFDNGKVE